MTRVALVTGGSSGIGEAAVLRLRKAGFEVYAAARRVERMDALRSAGVHPLGMDVTDEASMSAGVDRVLEEQGRVDVLVNNAGYGAYGTVEDVAIEEARRQFEVNLFGLARLTQLVIPPMREQGSGRIINISSIGGVIYTPFGAWYHATKHAVEAFSDVLRTEVRQFGIDVVVVRPAGIITEWNPIARESLVASSAEGEYADQAVRGARRFEIADRRPFSSGPKVVAKTIVKASTAEHPRTRYASGSGARLLPATRRLLPDRAFDALVSKAIGL